MQQHIQRAPSAAHPPVQPHDAKAVPLPTGVMAGDKAWTIAPDFSRDVVCLLGVAFDRISLNAAEQRIRDSIAEDRRCHIATPNVNLMRLARTDPAFRRALLGADLTLVDGMPLVWIARLLGLGVAGRAAGSDLFAALGKDRRRAIGTFFFGGTEAVCAQLKRKLKDNIMGVRCVGALAPGFGTVEEMSRPDVIDRVNAARPDLVVVAVSARKGLNWIARNEAALTAPVIANLGATIHFEAGTVKRAPEGWRRSGFEWLWRIRQEPQLWSRYAGDFGMLGAAMIRQVLPALALRPFIRPRKDARQESRVQIVSETGGGKTVHLIGAFADASRDVLREALASATRSPGPLTFDLSRTRYLDAEALGLLLLAHGHQHRIGRPTAVKAGGWRMRALLKSSGCGFLLTSDAPPPVKRRPEPRLTPSAVPAPSLRPAGSGRS